VLGTADTSKDNSFATNSGTGVFAAIGIGLAKQGCTKLGDLYADGGAILADNVKNGVESQGGKEVARAAVAANAPDVSPAVARITGAGAQCIALNVSPGAVVQALTALKQSGKTLTAGGVSAIFTKQILDSLGPLANGLIVAEMQLDGGDAAAPGIAAVTADVHAISASAPVTQAGVIGWISAKLVAAALPKVQGPVTATSLMAALNGLRNVSLDGVIPPWSSVELTSPAYKRLFNHYAINYKIENGVPIRQGDFFDMAPVLEGASAASSQ
jgi:branched-chain amino acid transport system substrate-binding protein